jgi:putative membrane protein
MKGTAKTFSIRTLQGSLIGIGAVLPGISGGVLCVAFGIYKIIMEFLASPFKNFKTHFPKLIPIIIGGIIGFLGIANLLSFVLERYPSQSVCVFVGLISGMLPSLFREAGEKGRNAKSFISLAVAMILIFALLISLKILSVNITPNFFWYLFCGFCLALSVIAPGMSFSTLLMPLGLYEPFVDGIGHLNFSILIPGAIGAIATVILFAKAINLLFSRHYSVSFHAIIGIVIAATVMIIPFRSFTESALTCIINIVCIVAGAAAALLLDKFNSKYSI